MLPIQERSGFNNHVHVTYTRGLDLSAGQAGLSGTFQGAGGIGGLLARTDTNANSALYFADGAGNITTLINSSGVKQASYLYDPFGNLLAMSGPLAAANHYRFSSKEWIPLSGDYYFGFRFYTPNLQRWRNADPIGFGGGLNPHRFVFNNPAGYVDPFGLQEAEETPIEREPVDPLTQTINNALNATGRAEPRELFSQEEREQMALDFLNRKPALPETTIGPAETEPEAKPEGNWFGRLADKIANLFGKKKCPEKPAQKPHLNNNDAESRFGIYEISVNGELYKVGKSDMNRVTQSSGLPTRLHQQIRILEKSFEHVEGSVVEDLGEITTGAAKAAERLRIQRIFDQTGIVPPGNQRSFP